MHGRQEVASSSKQSRAFHDDSFDQSGSAEGDVEVDVKWK